MTQANDERTMADFDKWWEEHKIEARDDLVMSKRQAYGSLAEQEGATLGAMRRLAKAAWQHERDRLEARVAALEGERNSQAIALAMAGRLATLMEEWQ